MGQEPARQPPFLERPPKTPLRDTLRFLILLLLPCYCVGLGALGLSTTWEKVQRGDPDAGWVVIGIIVAALVILTEPLHFGLTTVAELLTATDVGCALVLVLGIALVLFFVLL